MPNDRSLVYVKVRKDVKLRHSRDEDGDRPLNRTAKALVFNRDEARLMGTALADQPLDTRTPTAQAQGLLLPARATADGTLRRLQEAALVGFGERGYHGVSMRELAEAAGVRVSSVYAHVTAKEDLLFELTLMGHEEHNDHLRRALVASPPDPRAQMEGLVKAHATVHATYPLLTSVANKELHALSPENARTVMSVRHDSERILVDAVERGIDGGVFHCPDPWLAVAAIGGMGIRIAEWYDRAGPFSVEQVADSYAGFALKILS
jgi:AcrR family transcriptional regulator